MAEFANGAKWSIDPEAVVADEEANKTYVDIAEIVNIDLAGPTADTLDVSVHDDKWRRFVGGLASAGTAQMDVRFTTDEATHEQVMSLIGRSNPFAMKITGPPPEDEQIDPWVFECDGFITSAAPSFPHDGVASMNVQVQFSGEPILPTPA